MRISDWSSDVCSSDLVAASVTAWHPAVISGRRVGFAGELLAAIRQIAGEIGGATTASAETAATLLAGDRIDARAVADLVLVLARAVREETGGGLLLLIDRKSTRLNSSH